MNRKLTLRRLQRSLRVWQAATLCCLALLLAGAGVGALTGSSLRINADDASGDKVRVNVDNNAVFAIQHDGALRVGGEAGPLILTGAVDPSEAPAVVAPSGSIYLRTGSTGGLWVKQDATWDKVAAPEEP